MANSRRPAASRRAKSNRSKRVSSGRTLSGFDKNNGLSRHAQPTPLVQNGEATTGSQPNSTVRSSRAGSNALLELAARSATSPTTARTRRHAVGQSSPPRRSPRNSKILSESSTALSPHIPPAAAFPQEANVDCLDNTQARPSESPQQLRGRFATADIHVHCSSRRNRPLPTTWCRALLDTQSDENFISWRKYVHLRDRGFIDPGCPVSGTVSTLGLEKIIPGGVVFVKWHNDRHPDTQYNEKFLILPENLNAAFDFLIGQKCIEKNEFLIHNPRTMYLEGILSGVD